MVTTILIYILGSVYSIVETVSQDKVVSIPYFLSVTILTSVCEISCHGSGYFAIYTEDKPYGHENDILHTGDKA